MEAKAKQEKVKLLQAQIQMVQQQIAAIQRQIQQEQMDRAQVQQQAKANQQPRSTPVNKPENLPGLEEPVGAFAWCCGTAREHATGRAVSRSFGQRLGPVHQCQRGKRQVVHQLAQHQQRARKGRILR